jgi:hypothetical protein
MIAEVLGYVALAFLLYAYTHSDMWKLRIFGFLGSVVFTIQAGMVELHSLVVANIIFATIHLYHLRKLHLDKKVVDNG